MCLAIDYSRGEERRATSGQRILMAMERLRTLIAIGATFGCFLTADGVGQAPKAKDAEPCAPVVSDAEGKRNLHVRFIRSGGAGSRTGVDENNAARLEN